MGYYQQQYMDRNVCIPCARGTYKSQFGQFQCTNCPTGATTLETGADNCGKLLNNLDSEFKNIYNEYCLVLWYLNIICSKMLTDVRVHRSIFYALGVVFLLGGISVQWLHEWITVSVCGVGYYWSSR